jgi:hypothetical protein
MMKRSVIVISTCLFLLSASSGVAQPNADISNYLNTLSNIISQLPSDVVTPLERQKLLEYVDMINENQQLMHYSVTGDLIDVLLKQLVALGPDEDTMEQVVSLADQARADLFFGAFFLLPLPFDYYPMGMVCNVVIMVRSLLDIAFDPGGQLVRDFADTVELEAWAFEPGGTFTWDIDTVNDVYPVTRTGPRVLFRLIEHETVEVRVTYTNPLVGSCQDVLHVYMQGGYPIFD